MAIARKLTPKGAATRAALLAVASAVFARKGYSQTRMDDVIDAAGLTKGAIYFHFRSKAELAAAVVDDHKSRWFSIASARVREAGSPTEQLRLLTPLLGELISADASAWGVVRLSREIAIESGSSDSANPLADWVDLVAGILERGIESGEFDVRSDPRDAAAVIVGGYDGIKGISDLLDPADSGAFLRRTLAFQRAVEADVIRA